MPLASVTKLWRGCLRVSTGTPDICTDGQPLQGPFHASLELAKQGEAVLTQDGLFVEVFIERVNTSKLRDSNPMLRNASRSQPIEKMSKTPPPVFP